MTDPLRPNPPSPLVALWARRLAADYPADRRALDVATGTGRHALLLAREGFAVTAVDRRWGHLRDAHAAARSAGLKARFLCADLTTFPLPRTRFHLVVVTRYLDRERFHELRDALVVGGALIYETFTERQRTYQRGPRSSTHLLKPGELRRLAVGMDVLLDEEVAAPDAVARLVARRRA
jgi:SAM-dependent methyltransferase